MKFFAHEDEDAFFEWIKKIPCITHIRGELDVINICIASKKIRREELGSIVGLFRRYKVDVQQLEVLVNNKNLGFFAWSKKHYSINVYPAGRGE